VFPSSQVDAPGLCTAPVRSGVVTQLLVCWCTLFLHPVYAFHGIVGFFFFSFQSESHCVAHSALNSPSSSLYLPSAGSAVHHRAWDMALSHRLSWASYSILCKFTPLSSTTSLFPGACLCRCPSSGAVVFSSALRETPSSPPQAFQPQWPQECTCEMRCSIFHGSQVKTLQLRVFFFLFHPLQFST
jgi:hypothetical protein